MCLFSQSIHQFKTHINQIFIISGIFVTFEKTTTYPSADKLTSGSKKTLFPIRVLKYNPRNKLVTIIYFFGTNGLTLILFRECNFIV